MVEANATSRDGVIADFFDSTVKMGPKGKLITKAGVVFISPENYTLPYANSLTESCSNNVIEYNVLIIGLQIAGEMGVKYLEAYSETKLIIN